MIIRENIVGPVHISINRQGERRTSDTIADQADNVLQQLGLDKVCQIVTDSGGDCKAGRRKFCSRHPWILDSNCACHCLDLLLEDIFKKIEFNNQVADQGNAIVTYIRSHNLLRGQFKEKSGRTLLKPCDTRFGTTVIMLDRLNDEKTSVTQTFHSSKADELYKTLNKPTEKAKFREVLALVSDLDFWENLTYTLRLTIPVMHILRVCDNAKNSEAVGHVYMLMLELQEFFRTDTEVKADQRSKILEFVSSRWEMLHSPLMDAGYLLNPAYLINEPWTKANIMDGFHNLVDKWMRFMNSDKDALSQELMTYIEKAKTHDYVKNIKNLDDCTMF